MILFLEQLLNGLQFGFMLFLLAAGLTLIFGIMGIINLTHGSMYMIGAYAGAYLSLATGSFLTAALGAMLMAAVAGIIVEFLVVRRLYGRDYLDQVLATFALILIFNQSVTYLFGHQPLFLKMPSWLDVSVPLFTGLDYPLYRLSIIFIGILVAVGLYLFTNHTRIGMLIRAGSTNRTMVRALGVNIGMLYTTVFALGAMLAGLAGFMTGPLLAVQVGMGERILITTFVVVVVGGVGSIRGAFFASLIIGIYDTLLRAYLPSIFRQLISGSEADALATGISSMGIYLLMAVVLLVCPKGLFIRAQ